MRVSSNSFIDQFQYQVQNLLQQQDTLENEATTQLKNTLPEDDPGAMENFLNLQNQYQAGTQYQSNITSLQSAANNTYTPISGLQTLLTSAQEIATKATGGTASNTDLDTYATQISGLISQALQYANTQDANGNYVFSGTASSTVPFVATKDASGNYTSVAYQGNTSTAQVEISKGYSVTAQVPGENTTGTGATGLFADSRTGANVFQDLISLQQNLSAHNTSAISSTDIPALQKDNDNATNQLAANGILQSALNTANTAATTANTNINSSMSSLTSVDLATTLSQLQQSQTAYQAALESGAKVFSVSLLDYLK